MAWEPAVGDRAPLPAPLLPIAGELPFAGRAAERNALRVQWKSAQTDGQSVTLISGEPGVGKTRLTAELACRSLRGRMGPRGTLRRTDLGTVHALARDPPTRGRAHAPGGLWSPTSTGRWRLTRLVPESTARSTDVPEPRKLDPETEQRGLDAVVDVLETLAADAPVFLVIDDAHWADTSSLGLLRHAVRHLPAVSAVLAVVTYRDTDVDRTIRSRR